MIIIYKLGDDFKFHKYDTWNGKFSGPLSGLNIKKEEIEKRFNSAYYKTFTDNTIDLKKMTRDQLESVFSQLVEKGVIESKSGASSDKSRPGLVKKKVTVKRGGKTFQQERWVKGSEDEIPAKPGKGEEKPVQKPAVKNRKSWQFVD